MSVKKSPSPSQGSGKLCLTHAPKHRVLLALANSRYMNANPVFLGGLFPNGKYVGVWLPVLNR